MAPASVPDNCTALATMVDRTVSRSSVEFIVWDTSPNARSSPTERPSSSVRSRNSFSRRAFSMAMTAWAAKVRDQGDLLVAEGTHFLAVQGEQTDQFVLFQHWDNQ